MKCGKCYPQHETGQGTVIVLCPKHAVVDQLIEVRRAIRHMEAELEFIVQQQAYLRTKIADAEKALTAQETSNPTGYTASDKI